MAPVNDTPTKELLRQAFPLPLTEGAGNRAICAQVELYARTQHAFYVAFQALVLALGVAVLVALVLFIEQLTNGVDVIDVVGLLGSVVTGAAVGFLQKQAQDALKRYNDALDRLKETDCA
jgi:hypothetical protein